MKLLLTLIIAMSILGGAVFPFQVLLHYESGCITWQLTKQLCDDMKVSPEIRDVLILPASGIATHMIADALFQEGYMGTNQILRGGLKLGSAILLEPEELREEKIVIAFWNLLPDLIDKGFNLNIFHQYQPKQYMFSFDREQEEILEDYVLFDGIRKKVIKVPEGTVFVKEIAL